MCGIAYTVEFCTYRIMHLKGLPLKHQIVWYKVIFVHYVVHFHLIIGILLSAHYHAYKNQAGADLFHHPRPTTLTESWLPKNALYRWYCRDAYVVLISVLGFTKTTAQDRLAPRFKTEL